ncbi:hypothetical protein HK105_205447 [Polyrhizophydium stewartii]|uniref:Uncharacterized protein n=1 Tax=Polyrhizophydium stewartii TaxID=2732419 RepID=A0ABR4N5U0_9FUNG
MLTAKAVVSGSMQHIGPFDVSYYLMSNWGEFTDVGGTVSAAPFASEYCGSCSMPVVPDKPTCMFASWTNRMQIQGEWGPADDYGVNGWYFRDGIVNFAISFFREWQAANARRVGTHVSVDCGERFAAGNTTKAPPRTACVCEPDQWAQSFSVPASVRFVLWNNCVGAQAGYLEFSFTGQPQMSAPDSCPMFTAMFGTAAALGMPASQGAVSSAIQLFCGAQQLAGTMRLGL